MAPRTRDTLHTAIPEDAIGTILQDVGAPVDHPLLIKTVVYKNVSNEVVKLEMIFKESKTDPTPVTYRKEFTPYSGSLVITKSMEVFPWVKV